MALDSDYSVQTVKKIVIDTLFSLEGNENDWEMTINGEDIESGRFLCYVILY